MFLINQNVDLTSLRVHQPGAGGGGRSARTCPDAVPPATEDGSLAQLASPQPLPQPWLRPRPRPRPLSSWSPSPARWGARLGSQDQRKQDKKGQKSRPLGIFLWHLSPAYRGRAEGKKESSVSFYFCPLPATSPHYTHTLMKTKSLPFFLFSTSLPLFPGSYQKPPGMQMSCIMQIYANRA